MSVERSAKITVRKPCTCGALRWFLCVYDCPGREVVAVYDCEGYEEAPQAPTPASVAWVRAQHPTEDLIYLD